MATRRAPSARRDASIPGLGGARLSRFRFDWHDIVQRNEADAEMKGLHMISADRDMKDNLGLHALGGSNEPEIRALCSSRRLVALAAPRRIVCTMLYGVQTHIDIARATCRPGKAGEAAAEMYDACPRHEQRGGSRE